MKNLFPLALAALAFTTACKKDDPATPAPVVQITSPLTVANEVPGGPVYSNATGTFTGSYDPNTKLLTYAIAYSGLTGNATAGHLHFGDTKHSGIVFSPFANVPAATSGNINGTVTLTQMQADSLTAGHVYANIHTANNPNGEIRANLLSTGKANPTPVAAMQVGGSLTAASERPAPNASIATGTMTGTYDPNSKLLSYTITFAGLTGNASAGHLHFGDAKHTGNVTLPFASVPAATSGSITGTAILTQTQADSLTMGHIYANIHTANNPNGEIRANLITSTSPTLQVANALNPANEVPPVTNAPAATGSFVATYNPASKLLTYSLAFSGLTGNATAGHLHFGAAKHTGAVTLPFASLPAATSGLLTGTATLTQMQADSLTAGRLYANIHTAANPNGEIRANLTAK